METRDIVIKKEFGGITSFALHIFAMAVMLCDHLWATVLWKYDILTHIGRLAFPIFAFLIVEGFCHTHNIKKYMIRMLIFAVVAEIPFDMVYSFTYFYPMHQNVLWTFLISLLCMWAMKSVGEKVRALSISIGEKRISIAAIGICGLLILLAFLLGFAGMVDYYGPGVLLVIVFYVFRGRKWWQILGQILGMYWINCEMLAGLCLQTTIAGHTFEYPEQGIAMLALIPILLYKGKQGPYNKGIKYLYYAFYPVHCLILGMLAML